MTGKTLLHYQVAEKLGAGGMGEVYRARDTKLGRDVAIKVLPDAFARNPERLARFEREAQVLASLNHPNIAAIYGVEECDGVRFLVLELVPGDTLALRVAAGALPWEEALGVCRQIADALECAHEKGIVHRDLKPANVKVTPEGKVKVLDFGLAKAFGADSSITPLSHSPTLTAGGTREGVILGTAAYMSPEQARGKPVDKRTDIWAFGCVLYETLTGRQVFGGETVSDAIAVILSRDPDWNALPAATPPKIRDLLRRCLQKDPLNRLRDMGDARIEMDEAQAAPNAAPIVTLVPASEKKVIWFTWAGLGIGALVGALAAGVFFRQFQPSQPAPRTMRFSDVTNFAGVEAQPSLSPDGRSVAFISDRGNQFDVWVGLVTGGSLIRITNDPNFKARPRWAPDGSKIAFARLNEAGIWDVWLVPALGGTPRRILSDAGDPAWSPDGRSLAFSRGAAIWLSDASGGNARAVTQREEVFHRSPVFSHDGRQLAFVRRTAGPYGELAVTGVDTGKIRPLTSDGALALSPVWSSDDEFIYFASSRGGTVNIWKISAQGGRFEQITAGQGDDAELDLSADGKRMVFSSHRININIAEIAVDPAPGRAGLKWLTSDPARGEFGPAYSPDGSRIAYFSNRKGAEKESIWVMGSDGSNPMQLVEDEHMNIFPRWGADGQTLFYSSGLGGFVNNEIRSVALSGAAPQTLHAETTSRAGTPNALCDVGPDGRLLLPDTDGRAKIFDPKTKQDQILEGVRGGLLRWSPDGRAFAYIVAPNPQGGAGLWVYTLPGTQRQVFKGWVVWYAWAGPEELFVLEGKPNLNAPLWRVRLDGQGPVRTSTTVRLLYSYTNTALAQFDVHPDRRRIATQAVELQEADIGMIENIR